MGLDGLLLSVCPMPTHKGRLGRSEIDVLALDQIVSKQGIPQRVFIERVGPVPGSSRLSAFTFGRNWEALIAWSKLREFPHDFIEPKAWKKLLGTSDTSKSASVSWSWRSYPSWKATIGTSDGLAEAILIAECGRRQWKIS